MHNYPAISYSPLCDLYSGTNFVLKPFVCPNFELNALGFQNKNVDKSASVYTEWAH